MKVLPGYWTDGSDLEVGQLICWLQDDGSYSPHERVERIFVSKKWRGFSTARWDGSEWQPSRVIAYSR